MPEKRKVSIAPGTKIKENGKSGGTKRNSAIAKDLNPIQRSKESIKRSYDVRKTRENIGDKIKYIQEEQDNDIKDLLDKISFYRKDSEKILRQQALTFGTTLDDMNGIKHALDKARDTNDTLYREVESRKEECDKLQIEMDNLVERINELAMDKSDLRYEQKVHEREKIKLKQNESKIHDLVKSNGDLRRLAHYHKLNPSVDASKIKTNSPLVKTASPKRETISAYQEPNDSRFPKVFTKRALMSFNSMEDVRQPRKPVKLAPLRRSRSYNQQKNIHFMPAHEFLRRRPSNTVDRMRQTRFEVLI